MNKQQLAQKIWASANQMRSKIEANEYKDVRVTSISQEGGNRMTFQKEADFEEALIKVLADKGWEKEVIKNPTEQDLIRNWAKDPV